MTLQRIFYNYLTNKFGLSSSAYTLVIYKDKLRTQLVIELMLNMPHNHAWGTSSYMTDYIHEVLTKVGCEVKLEKISRSRSVTRINSIPNTQELIGAILITQGII